MCIYKVLATIQSNDSIKVQFDKPLHFVGLCREHTWMGVTDSMNDSKTAQCFKVTPPCVIASWKRHKGLSLSLNILFQHTLAFPKIVCSQRMAGESPGCNSMWGSHGSPLIASIGKCGSLHYHYYEPVCFLVSDLLWVPERGIPSLKWFMTHSQIKSCGGTGMLSINSGQWLNFFTWHVGLPTSGNTIFLP